MNKLFLLVSQILFLIVSVTGYAQYQQLPNNFVGQRPGIPVYLYASTAALSSSYDNLGGVNASYILKPMKGTVSFSNPDFGLATMTYTGKSLPIKTRVGDYFDQFKTMARGVGQGFTFQIYTVLPQLGPFRGAKFDNRLPIAKNYVAADALENNYETQFLIPFSVLLAGCTDPDNDQLTILALNYKKDAQGKKTTKGTLAFDPAAKTITYIPPEGYNGSDFFEYIVTDRDSRYSRDGYYGIATGTVEIKVTTNQPPVANADNLGIIVGQSSWDESKLLDNDTDPDIGTKLNDTIALVSVTDVDKTPGTVTFENGKVVYTATKDAGGYKTGSTKFSYTIKDKQGKTATGMANLIIGECNNGDECPDGKPFCNATTKMCEACSSDAQCGIGSRAAKKACNTNKGSSTFGQCVVCTGDGFCPDDKLARCDLTTNTCMTCDDNKQCQSHPGKTVCNSTTGGCVECKSDVQCSSRSDDKKSCNTSTNVCVKCTNDNQCAGRSDGKNLCKIDQNICVSCLNNSNCTDPNAARCDTNSGQCTGCSNNNQCGNFAGKNICAGGKCVGCGSDSDCKDPNAASCLNPPLGECVAVTLVSQAVSSGTNLVVKLSPVENIPNFQILDPKATATSGLTASINGMEVTVTGTAGGSVTVTGDNIKDYTFKVCYD